MVLNFSLKVISQSSIIQLTSCLLYFIRSRVGEISMIAQKVGFSEFFLSLRNVFIKFVESDIEIGLQDASAH
jgi:hypothetical protein